MNDQTIFISLVSTSRGRTHARLLIESIRAFGGPLSQSPIWLFEAGQQVNSEGLYAGLDVEFHPLAVPDSVNQNWFAGKVYACARAEELAGSSVQSLIWMSSDCLIIQPPVLFELGSSFDAAFRPVHIRNIGLLTSDPLDAFWERVYSAVGVDDVQATVETFVDDRQLRAYYNTHAFAINPAKGFMRQWYKTFEVLVGDKAFQESACRDELHQIFLHQAVLSTLIPSRLEPDRIRMLPPDYNYPYNLQGQIPAHKRAAALSGLVCIAYEDRSLNPDEVKDIDIHEPLRSWLLKKTTEGEAVK